MKHFGFLLDRTFCNQKSEELATASRLCPGMKLIHPYFIIEFCGKILDRCYHAHEYQFVGGAITTGSNTDIITNLVLFKPAFEGLFGGLKLSQDVTTFACHVGSDAEK